ncbi:MAG: glutamine--fructose-6-phosphate transaminase (isomerizing) [Planctomycetes bacterium]|nr:glutamine--fructose-6-phosphate transaminase (isomerizing) [Planctomycetota bacterium]MCB9904140.1 glutamine--fructose-6-phosphate transaminase (isomerizing) [Planctomycetota bacterium]
MCGIVGAVLTEGSVLEGLLGGLRVLEYRGYDSAGVALGLEGGVSIRRKAGRIEKLEDDLRAVPLADSPIGIGHTRWATHGPPTDENAHPHTDNQRRLALVHNGIIENHSELRAELEAEGVTFSSGTDTEALAHLLGRELDRSAPSLAEALRRALRLVHGYYAVAAMRFGDEKELVCARQGPPICVGVTPEGSYLGSDVLALIPHTRDIVFLEDGDVCELAPGRMEVTRIDGSVVQRASHHVSWEEADAGKGVYPHYMLKEIHEQPDVLARTAFSRIDEARGDVNLGHDELGDGGWSDALLQSIDRVQVAACGTALHAGYIARYLIEGLARIPVDVDYASEFRYRDPVLAPNTLALAISQSGETADTLAAQRLAREKGCTPAAICNVAGSTLVRESDAVVLTNAGPEIGVASTKAFVAQVIAAYLLAVRLGRARGVIDRVQGLELVRELRLLRPSLERLLSEDHVAEIKAVAGRHLNAKGFMFLGRGINYPVALEGALKLKEISYMHAEGYPAGEMKHGPIALIEPGMSTVVVNSRGLVADKARSNVEQVRARGGQVICVGSDPESLALADEAIEVPRSSEWLSPVLNVIPLQLLSYEIARLRGCDIDKPRNLAKSVTVE